MHYSIRQNHAVAPSDWPKLDAAASRDTWETLHIWTQIVGKIRLVQTPWLNHSWHVPLYVGPRGLSTSPIPYGARSFQIDFDFIDQRLLVTESDGATRMLDLRPGPVSRFYQELFAALSDLGLNIGIRTRPCEIADALPFEKDQVHTAYDGQRAAQLWRALLQADRVLKQFRTGFIGKCSPVHFFWGSFDLAVTRFSGRQAPAHPGGIPNLPDWVTRDAYSHEVSSCGFWPGGGATPFPLFYCYAYPEPAGFGAAVPRVPGASYDGNLHEFILPYAQVQQAPEPDALLLEFLEAGYEAAARLAEWPRRELEYRSGPSREK